MTLLQPKSIITCLLNLGLNIILKGFISLWTTWSMCISNKAPETYFLNLIFYGYSWILTNLHTSVANWILSSYKIMSKPQMFFTSGPISSYEKIINQKYSLIQSMTNELFNFTKSGLDLSFNTNYILLIAI